jgi:hypothetical protein
MSGGENSPPGQSELLAALDTCPDAAIERLSSVLRDSHEARSAFETSVRQRRNPAEPEPEPEPELVPLSATTSAVAAVATTTASTIWRAASPRSPIPQLVRVFSYGSNGTAQLRARVQNPALQSVPARVEGYARIFCLRSRGWGGSGVASLAPCEGVTTYGAVVGLSLEELQRLDSFEGGYEKQRMRALVGKAGVAVEVVAYIACNPTWRQPPNEPYLCAIHAMLREHWSMEGEAIDVRSCQPDGNVRTHSRWIHPGAAWLSLPALVVEANTRKHTPWEMPATIQQVQKKLAVAGVRSSTDLADALMQPPSQTGSGVSCVVNERMSAAGQLPFKTETLDIFSELLLPPPRGAAEEQEQFVMVYGSLAQSANVLLVVTDMRYRV